MRTDPIRRGSVRALVLAAALAVSACDGDVAAPGAGSGLVLTVTSAQVTADQGRLHIEGPTNRTVTLSPGDSREIDLPAGTYSVALEGLSGGTVVGYWERGSVTVSEGRQTSLTVSLAAFQASTPSAGATAVTGQPFTVSWSPVTGAASYDVEVSASPSFGSLIDQQNVSGTSAQFTVSQSGTVYFRVRARTRFGGVGNYGQPSSGTLVRVPVQRVEVDPEFSQIDVGQTVTLTATAYGPSNEVLTGRSVTWTSVTPGVAEVNSSGVVTGRAPGEAEIVALIEGVEKSAFVVVSDPNGPQTAAPTPTYDAANVISLFSDAYTDVPVDTWSAQWDQADVLDVLIQGNATKRYSNLVFAGIETLSQTIDATGMTHFRMDVWTPDETSGGQVFRLKLVDFGADGAFGGGDDVEHELTFDATTSPALTTGSWITIEVPLSAFQNLTTRAHMAQFIISGDPNTVYVDNILFFDNVGAPAINSYDVVFLPVIQGCGAGFRDFRTDEAVAYLDNDGTMNPTGRTFEEPTGGSPTGIQSQWREEGATDWKAFGYSKGWTPDGNATGTSGILSANGSTCWGLQSQPTYVDFRVRVQDADGNWSPWFEKRLKMPASVTINPGQTQRQEDLAIGSSRQYSAEARDADGNLVPGDPINWSNYTGSPHATISPTGLYQVLSNTIGGLDHAGARAGYAHGTFAVSSGFGAGTWFAPGWLTGGVSLSTGGTLSFQMRVYEGRQYTLRTGDDPNQTSSGDLDLFIRLGQPATTTTFDASSEQPALVEQIDYTAPADGILHILLYGFDAPMGANFQVDGLLYAPPSRDALAPAPPLAGGGGNSAGPEAGAVPDLLLAPEPGAQRRSGGGEPLRIRLPGGG